MLSTPRFRLPFLHALHTLCIAFFLRYKPRVVPRPRPPVSGYSAQLRVSSHLFYHVSHLFSGNIDIFGLAFS